MKHFFLFLIQEIDPSEEREVQQLKEEVRKAFIAAPLASLEKLELIDKIQRLGVDYHFENEIEASIRHIFDNYDDCNKGDDENNLYIVALRFRLLRQEGHHISCGNNKFDTSASNEVPQYLKKVYLTILATTTEMEEVMAKENKLFHVAYAIGEMKKSVRAYHQEFIWFYTKHVPTFEEYLKVSLATTCYMTLATTSLVGMGDIVTKEVLDWITSEPLAIKANCSICRLMDDIIGHEFEQERGHVVSAVECYTKEYNVSEQEAYVEIENLISKAWKDLNQECLHPTPVPMKEIDPSEEREVQQLKEEVRKLLIAAPPASLEKLELVDKIQRLGVDYHFEKEIEASLQHIFDNYDNCNKGDDENNLYVVALRFRLLRQEGHHISCGVFEKFLDKNGKFKDSLTKDLEGMLSLYEASYLGLPEETTLDEALTFTTDDLYDVYGTKDELQLFTNAIQRFETSASDEVPQYLKKIYLAILDITTEMEEVMAKENKLFHVSYAIGEMKKQIRTYYQEFMWFYTKHVPPFEEYLKVSLVSSCYMMIATTCLVGMGDIITKEVLDWVTSEPLAVKATCSICRLMDDMIGHEFEQERGHVASAVECYMKGYNVSKEEAYVGIEKLISRAWKDINQECLHPLPVPMKVLLRVLNLARAIFLIYKDNDIYTFSQVKFKSLITATLVQPVTI
nr:(-)-germacrene D synthase-like [Ipomoea batatas]